MTKIKPFYSLTTHYRNSHWHHRGPRHLLKDFSPIPVEDEFYEAGSIRQVPSKNNPLAKIFFKETSPDIIDIRNRGLLEKQGEMDKIKRRQEYFNLTGGNRLSKRREEKRNWRHILTDDVNVLFEDQKGVKRISKSEYNVLLDDVIEEFRREEICELQEGIFMSELQVTPIVNFIYNKYFLDQSDSYSRIIDSILPFNLAANTTETSKLFGKMFIYKIIILKFNGEVDPVEISSNLHLLKKSYKIVSRLIKSIVEKDLVETLYLNQNVATSFKELCLIELNYFNKTKPSFIKHLDKDTESTTVKIERNSNIENNTIIDQNTDSIPSIDDIQIIEETTNYNMNEMFSCPPLEINSPNLSLQDLTDHVYKLSKQIAIKLFFTNPINFSLDRLETIEEISSIDYIKLAEMMSTHQIFQYIAEKKGEICPTVSSIDLNVILYIVYYYTIIPKGSVSRNDVDDIYQLTRHLKTENDMKCQDSYCLKFGEYLYTSGSIDGNILDLINKFLKDESM